MTPPIKPIATRILVKLRESATAISGIILPEQSLKREVQGHVVAIGPKVEHVKVGQAIVLLPHTGLDVPGFEGYVLVREQDVGAIITSDGKVAP